MGLTLIQRAAGTRPPADPKIALVLAGGAVSGGGFKVGGLTALDRFLVGRKVNDFDLYVGLSAGAFLATSLAGGVTPDEMVEVLNGTSSRMRQLRPLDFYRPNLSELLGRPVRFGARVAAYVPGLMLDLVSAIPDLPRKLGPTARRLWQDPGYTALERFVLELFQKIAPKRQFPKLGSLLPSGLFDNAPLERWLAQNMRRIGAPNDFSELYRATGKKLFLTATQLDSSERVVFGPDASHGLSISQAVQASSAIPGFFRPARLGGVDYVDGGVCQTANIDVAIEQGADLVICYNPFRPFVNEPSASAGGMMGRFLAERGLTTVMNQVFRTLLHTRLKLALQAYLADQHFCGDIVVIEANETDESFFDLKPMDVGRRSDAVRHGFESVYQTLSDHADELAPLLAGYGLEFSRPAPAAAEIGSRAAPAGPRGPRRAGRRQLATTAADLGSPRIV
ncbi:MAG: patatin-like phospholipase family protein [Myxococcales bacterium]|nr:patatin-like phospholipase family protein [Myxococcales bacterium]